MDSLFYMSPYPRTRTTQHSSHCPKLKSGSLYLELRHMRHSPEAREEIQQPELATIVCIIVSLYHCIIVSLSAWEGLQGTVPTYQLA